MNQTVIKMFTQATMYLDEEDMSPLYDIAKGTTIIESPRGESVGGTNYWVVEDPRRTRAEAKERLEYASIPFRVIGPFVPPKFKPVVIGIPELADILIEWDPLERLED